MYLMFFKLGAAMLSSFDLIRSVAQQGKPILLKEDSAPLTKNGFRQLNMHYCSVLATLYCVNEAFEVLNQPLVLPLTSVPFLPSKPCLPCLSLLIRHTHVAAQILFLPSAKPRWQQVQMASCWKFTPPQKQLKVMQPRPSH